MGIISDVHGNMEKYTALTNRVDSSIQLGDMGVGFGSPDPVEELLKSGLVNPLNHRFFRGNHDNPSVCRTCPSYLGDWGYLGRQNVFFVGGASSIDRKLRTEGRDWWPDEEISNGEWAKMKYRYMITEPRFMITHDAPWSVCQAMFPEMKKKGCSLTQTILQKLLEIHRPEFWFFGHWHKSKMMDIHGTRFRCLGVNEIFYVDEIPGFDNE